jgi:lysylphosphatidylglycerol synthetase-like protein (DUF2156 family)
MLSVLAFVASLTVLAVGLRSLRRRQTARWEFPVVFCCIAFVATLSGVRHQWLWLGILLATLTAVTAVTWRSNRQDRGSGDTSG